MIPQLVDKYFVFYGTQTFIIILMRACHPCDIRLFTPPLHTTPPLRNNKKYKPLERKSEKK
jgi:hypothetical protein